MSRQQMPWSFYSTLLSFALFFACINIYILTLWLDHPLASNLWLIGVVIGFILLVYSIRMVRIHQREMIAEKQANSEQI
ncbi:hypothetical protein E4H12_07970 [Candidatus Thorarchaeota archaeon]|nr:MAG: hypothetical protein E4H12_07970 [Candidatus Thorarchaeota archaeon]